MSLIFILSTGCSRFFKDHQIKAVQAGVQVDLNLILQTEKDFHKRFGFFTTDLGALRIAPENALYKVGFVKASSKSLSTARIKELKGKLTGTPDVTLRADLAILEKLDPNVKDLDAVRTAHKDWIVKYSPVTQLDKIDFGRMASFCPDCTATAQTFRAVAVANLNEDPILDVWTIDQDGKVQHLIDDLK